MIVSWVAPAFTGKLTRKHPIIFSHLLERVTELSIVLFGETIVGIAGYFTRQTFSVVSVLIFLIVASLFFAYIAVFDHLVDDKKAGETGNLLIYLHYPIIFGVSMVTVALRDITAPTVHHAFAMTFLYAGIGLMYLGLWLARYYQQARYQTHQTSYVVIAGLLVVAYGMTLVLVQPLATVVVTAFVSLAAAALLARQIDPAGH
ncbi:MAG: low temperature requirement protein A [Lactobacillus sp.]|nr:low temperature requirement protein A [Lacticaseibacillus suilingensis]MCI1894233.1 low temperature requirement protein A [Lactobacillus sp.]MCI2016962.1 low temperature requirement protein A [Lactobacillus sp.]MCI2036832.1 low temperature requirement protein A [Lactobacillus sp.]